MVAWRERPVEVVSRRQDLDTQSFEEREMPEVPEPKESAGLGRLESRPTVGLDRQVLETNKHQRQSVKSMKSGFEMGPTG